MKKLKLKTFAVTLVLSLLVPLTAYCADYGQDFPTYIPYSGGAYCEVLSTLGRGSIIVQDTYKTGYFGFSGSGYSLCNLSNVSITGKYIAQNGSEYSCRFSSFSTAQYYYESGTTREWRDLNITSIYNTNIEFIDYTDNDRANQLDLFDSDPYKYFVVCGVAVQIILFIIFTFRRKD